MDFFAPSLVRLENRSLMTASLPASLPDAPHFLQASRAFFEANPVFRVNDAGVLETKFSKIYSVRQWEVSPHNVARYAISLYAAWKAGDATALEPLVRQGEWLKQAIVAKPDGLGRNVFVTPYTFSITAFGTPRGFVSGLAAASETCALFLAARACGRPDWEQAAYNLTYVFDQPVSRWGVRVPLAKGVWFEEYAHPTRDGRTPLVLNGHLYACSWLYWYHKAGTFAPSATARLRGLYDAGMQAAADRLPLYDDPGVMSVYDLQLHGHNPAYHHAHVALLRWHATVTGNPVLTSWADRWASYEVPPH